MASNRIPMERILATPDAYFKAYVKVTTDVPVTDTFESTSYEGYIFPRVVPTLHRTVMFVTLSQDPDDKGRLICFPLMTTDIIELIRMGV